jgi:hypothetical protein
MAETIAGNPEDSEPLRETFEQPVKMANRGIRNKALIWRVVLLVGRTVYLVCSKIAGSDSLVAFFEAMVRLGAWGDKAFLVSRFGS